MIRVLVVAFALVIVATPAFARRCPQEMAKIDAALPTAQVSQAEKQRATDLRRQGEEHHRAGRHPESERALDQAKAILKIQ
jgi:hypothetical protein